jgi:hypothetical protein
MLVDPVVVSVLLVEPVDPVESESVVSFPVEHADNVNTAKLPAANKLNKVFFVIVLEF